MRKLKLLLINIRKAMASKELLKKEYWEKELFIINPGNNDVSGKGRARFTRITRKKAALIGLLIFALGAGVLANGLLKKPPATGVKKETRPLVQVIKVKPSDMYKKISFFGNTVAKAEVDLAAKYTGIVKSVNVELGQQVHEGDVLIIQDTKDIDIAINKNAALLRQAQADTIQTESNFNANFIKIKAEYDKGILNYQRYSKLYEMGAISKTQLETMEQNMVDARSGYEAMSNQMLSESNSATVEMKRQNVNQINYSIEQLEVQRDDYLIKAPMDGTIAYRKAERGSYLQAGQKVLSLISKKQFYIDCILPEQEIAAIKLDMVLKVYVSALGKEYNGKIIFVSSMNEEGTKGYKVRILLLDQDEELKDGMFAKTSINVLQRANTIYVPKEAILNKNSKNYLYVLDENNKVHATEVEIGLKNGSDVEILKGLSSDSRIATDNISRLENNMQVDVKKGGE